MRGIADDPLIQGAHIHIAPGTYLTRGLRYSITVGNPPTTTFYGWNVHSGWAITGAGEGATTIKLERWPGNIVVPPGYPHSKWSVIGSQGDFAGFVSDVVIENLTVDGNWLNLLDDGKRPPGYPETAQVALGCVVCLIEGSITHRNITITGFYGYAVANTECFALSCHGVQPMDPKESTPSQLAVFDHCTVHHGHGDYNVGIASFHSGPSIINGCQIYSLPGVYSFI